MPFPTVRVRFSQILQQTSFHFKNAKFALPLLIWASCIVTMSWCISFLCLNIPIPYPYCGHLRNVKIPIFFKFQISDLVLKVRQPQDSEVPLFQPNTTLISFLYPGQNKPLIEKLAEKKINAFGKKLGRDVIFYSEVTRSDFYIALKITLINFLWRWIILRTFKDEFYLLKYIYIIFRYSFIYFYSYGLRPQDIQSPGFRRFEFNGQYLRLSGCSRSSQSFPKVLCWWVTFHCVMRSRLIAPASRFELFICGFSLGDKHFRTPGWPRHFSDKLYVLSSGAYKL